MRPSAVFCNERESFFHPFSYWSLLRETARNELSQLKSLGPLNLGGWLAGQRYCNMRMTQPRSIFVGILLAAVETIISLLLNSLSVAWGTYMKKCNRGRIIMQNMPDQKVMVIISGSFCLKINQSRSLRVGGPTAQMLVTSPETAHPLRKVGSPSQPNCLTNNRSRREQRNTLHGSYITRINSEEEFAFQRFPWGVSCSWVRWC